MRGFLYFPERVTYLRALILLMAQWPERDP